MNEPATPVTAKGVNVVVTFDGRMLRIEHRTPTRTKEKRIPVSSITAVEWKQPGRFRPGRIGFTVPGDQDDAEASFLNKSAGEFEALRDAVEAALG